MSSCARHNSRLQQYHQTHTRQQPDDLNMDNALYDSAARAQTCFCVEWLERGWCGEASERVVKQYEPSLTTPFFYLRLRFVSFPVRRAITHIVEYYACIKTPNPSSQIHISNSALAPTSARCYDVTATVLWWHQQHCHHNNHTRTTRHGTNNQHHPYDQSIREI